MLNSTNTLSEIAAQVSNYTCVTYLDDIQLSDGLLSGSIKRAAIVACSDMGIRLPYVCSNHDVPLYLFQNFGHSFEIGGMIETVAEMGVEDVVVYGHSECEFIKYLAKLEEGLSSEDEGQCRLYSAALESDSEEEWKNAGQYNVLKELKKMLENPILEPLAKNGKLKIHGWFYNSAIKQIEVFDPKKRVFRIVNK